MGHRREIFRPKTKKEVRNQILSLIHDNKFGTAVKLAAFSYSSRPIADDFSISFIAALEAIKLGRELGWEKKSEDLAILGLSLAETKLNVNVNRKRRPIIIEALAKSIEFAKKEAFKK